MNKKLVLIASLVTTSALAEEPRPPGAQANPPGAQGQASPAPESTPAVQKPGPETKALEPIAADMTWTGTLKAGAMGEGTPEKPTKGRQKCSWSVNGLWLTCDIEDSMGETDASKIWKAKLSLGWDRGANEYRALIFDNMGFSSAMGGKIEGQKLVLTSITDMKYQGKSMKSRITFDWADPKAIKFTNECSKDGGDYQLIQEATMRPTRRHKVVGAPSA